MAFVTCWSGTKSKSAPFDLQSLRNNLEPPRVLMLMARKGTSTQPYWLDPGPHAERCRHCLQSYARETEVRCPSCDTPSCPDCAPEASVRDQDDCGCRGCKAEEKH